MKRYILAITGASGSLFGLRVLEGLIGIAEVHLTLSSQSFPILLHETGLDWSGGSDAETERRIQSHFRSPRIYYYNERDLAAPLSSGSFVTEGMLVVPCSMKTLAGIANGYTNTLAERAADVTLKEGRPLLLSPREMPFSAIHLENMLRLARLGVRIAPPVPAFYPRPKDLDELVNFVAGKILDCFGVSHKLYRRWGTEQEKRPGGPAVKKRARGS
ncbi:MAG: UbiX family flavin prenyltransferase [Nitrospirae bacterium]|nr:UbiX family flavin prenyltransferase [Nitrospirota bacterium]